EHGVEAGRLALELEAKRSLPEQRLSLVEGVYRQRARFGGPALTCGNRVVVAIAADDEIRAVRPDLVDLRGRADGRHENAGWNPERHRSVRDGGAMVTARRGNHAGFGDVARQQIREGAAHLERAGALQQFELERDAGFPRADVAAVDLHDRR